ncbi:uncharacterized protein N7459_006329 [Penicillium hispanicum]|uniref:uncharacterized protein n=1 Tax=Penicillium hispanicum TaxID=1080232 RepID=UPI002540D653|nr:uncharacterized protein N7459_006329 [Penicillium hispanicum]KAJ5580344.1 hypothetical protein N7459_006329 [Penicillium hispanicum]
MVTLSYKVLVAVAISMSSSVTLACLQITGSTELNNDYIRATDSGVQTCNGYFENGDSNLDCIKDYSFNYDYTDNNSNGPLPVTYCNPTNCFGIEVPLECHGISGCTFNYTTFCN